MDFFDFVKNNKLIILIVSIVMNVLLLFLAGYMFYKNMNYECVCENDDIAIEDKVEVEKSSFKVEIKGAVKNPGVYEANKDNIINDIVELAGGFTKKAYTNNINLSKKVSDELVIYVYTTTEYKKKDKEEIVTIVEQSPCDCSSYIIDNCTENYVSEIVSSDKDTNFSDNNTTNEIKVEDNSTKEETSSLININTASKEELMNLSGIGESKANAIIEYRQTSGSFKAIEDIKNVSGIGDSLFEKIKDSITV